MKWTQLRERWLKDPEVRRAYDGELPLLRLGAKVAVRRRELKLSQVELARQAEVTQRQVSAIENGRTNATIATLARIARVLKLTLQLHDDGVFALADGQCVIRFRDTHRVSAPATLSRKLKGRRQREFSQTTVGTGRGALRMSEAEG